MFNNTTNIFIDTLASLQKLDDLERLVNPNSEFFQSYRNSLAEVTLQDNERQQERTKEQPVERGSRASNFTNENFAIRKLPSLEHLSMVNAVKWDKPVTNSGKDVDAVSITDPTEFPESNRPSLSLFGFTKLDTIAPPVKLLNSTIKDIIAPDIRLRTKKNPTASPTASKCTCSNSRCLKLYCACFAAGEVCGPQCQCKSCFNNKVSDDIRQKMIEETLQKNPNAFTSKYKRHAKKNEVVHVYGCHCTKTGCIKEYCECFKIGTGCSQLCKCVNCQNKKLELQTDEVKDYFVKTIRKRRKTKFYEQQFGNNKQRSMASGTNLDLNADINAHKK